MLKLEIIAEQTLFLLEKHKQTRDYCDDLFSDLQGVVSTKLAQLKSEGKAEDAEKVGHVATFVDATKKEYGQAMSEDIEFLEGQMQTVKSVLDAGDSAKSEEFAALLLEDEELNETEAFKKEIEQEAVESMASFSAITEDIKHALLEDNIDELMAYLEDMLAEDETLSAAIDKEQEGEDQDQDDATPIFEGLEYFLDEEGGSCCKGTKNCGDACTCSKSCGDK